MKVFLAHSPEDRDLVTAVRTELRRQDDTVFDPAEFSSTNDALSYIASAIRSTDAILAVLSRPNPNIYYELGVAVGAGIPVLVVAPNLEYLPINLASVPFVQLTGNDVSDAAAIASRLANFRIPPRGPEQWLGPPEAKLYAAHDREPIEGMNPAEFEQLISQLLIAKGFVIHERSAAADAGFDLIIEEPERKRKIIVETKKLSRQSRVSVDAVRQLLSALSVVKAPLGLLISSSGFTSAAMMLAAATPIILCTIEKLMEAQSTEDVLRISKLGDLSDPRLLMEMQAELDELTDQRRIFWEILDHVFTSTLPAAPFYPATLNALIDSSEPPPGIPVGRGEHIRDFPAVSRRLLQGTSALLWDFCVRVYPAKAKGFSLAEQSAVGGNAFDSFHAARAVHAKMWNRFASMIYADRGISLDEVARAFGAHRRLVKILTYLELALVQWTEDFGEGKSFLFRLNRDWEYISREERLGG